MVYRDTADLHDTGARQWRTGDRAASGRLGGVSYGGCGFRADSLFNGTLLFSPPSAEEKTFTHLQKGSFASPLTPPAPGANKKEVNFKF